MDPNLIVFVIYVLSVFSITVYHLSAPRWPGLSEKGKESKDITRLLQESPCQLISFQKLVTPGRSVCEVSLRKQPSYKSPAGSLNESYAEDTEELICVVEQELHDLRSNAVVLVEQRERKPQEGQVSTWVNSHEIPLTSLIFWLGFLLLVGLLLLLGFKPDHIPSCPSCCKKTTSERKVVYLQCVQTQTPRPRKRSSYTQTEAVPEKISRLCQTEGPLRNPVRESLRLLEI